MGRLLGIPRVYPMVTPGVVYTPEYTEQPAPNVKYEDKVTGSKLNWRKFEREKILLQI